MASEVRHTFYSGQDPAPPKNGFSEAVSILEDMDRRRKEDEKGIKADLTIHEVRQLVEVVRKTEASSNEYRTDLLAAEKELDKVRKELKARKLLLVLAGVVIVLHFIASTGGLIPRLF